MARGWGIAPQDIWGMTLSEILHEFEWRRPSQKTDYAGGMTTAEIEEIKADSARLRAKLEKAQNNGDTPTP